MSKISGHIIQLRKQIIDSGILKSYEEINCGDCVAFAEKIEFLSNYTSVKLDNDNFCNVGGEGWNFNDSDEWSEKWLEEFNSLPPDGIAVSDLTHKISGYHCWIYSDGKHYDAECPEGVGNFFELPFFKRLLERE